ncbi:hypothetical protein [Streptomyces sp. AB3(2024)]|uniref:hypothetical protein n=1 Tax=Streptomyces sp. AB3(2024) TaxID=3317321 RepID=UPI0035A33332
MTAVVTLAGTPASAADTAYNTRSVWLDGVPVATDAGYHRSAGPYTFGSLLDPHF